MAEAEEVKTLLAEPAELVEDYLELLVGTELMVQLVVNQERR